MRGAKLKYGHIKSDRICCTVYEYVLKGFRSQLIQYLHTYCTLCQYYRYGPFTAVS